MTTYLGNCPNCGATIDYRVDDGLSPASRCSAASSETPGETEPQNDRVSGSPNCYPLRVRVVWHLGFKDVDQTIDVHKDFVWPCLLPVGSTIYPHVEDGDCIDPLVVLSYTWQEKDGAIHCWCEPWRELTYNDWFPWIEENGWIRGG